MNLVADESVDGPIVERLRHDGHDVLYMAEVDPGIDDDEVLALAKERNALLLTADKDFGHLVFRLERTTAGVALLRLPGIPPQRKAEMVVAYLSMHGAEMVGALTVVSRSGLRIRDVGSTRT